MSAVQLRRRTAVLAVLLALGAAACDSGVSVPTEYYAPVGTLTAGQKR